MRVGGKPLKVKPPQPNAPNKVRADFYGNGVKMGVAKGAYSATIDVVKVSPETFRNMGAVVGGWVFVGLKGEERVARVAPGNKTLKGEVVVPKGYLPDGTTHVMVRHCDGVGITPAGTVTVLTANTVVSGLREMLQSHMMGKLVEKKAVELTFTVLSTEYVFTVALHEDHEAAAAYVAPETQISFIEAAPSGGKTAAHPPAHRPAQFPHADWEFILNNDIRKVLLTGDPGVGKTYCAVQLGRAKSGHHELVVVTDASLNDSNVVSAARFAVGPASKRQCIVLDNVQSDEGGTFIDELLVAAERNKAQCVLVQTAPSGSTGNLGQDVCVVGLETPGSVEERRKLLGEIAGVKAICRDGFEVRQEAIDETAVGTHGFTAADLSMVVSYAMMLGTTLPKSSKLVRPSSLKTLEISVPSVRWTDIGGQEETKQLLKECVEWPLRHRDLFDKMNIRPPSGVLLYGPPGCSKTMLAKALATECTYNFIAVKGPELYDKYVGESEKAVRNVFRKARGAAPAVIFFDEIDGMCGTRGGGGVSDRVISQFLTEMDGLPSQNEKNHVIVLAATNRPDHIDPALLRPGRIDRKVYISLPNEPAVESICRLTLAGVPLAPNVSLPKLTAALTGRSGAEIVASLKEGILTCLTRNPSATEVDQRDLIRGINKVQPRTSKADLAFYESWGAKR